MISLEEKEQLTTETMKIMVFKGNLLNVLSQINYLLDKIMNYLRFTIYILKSLTEELSFPDPLSSVRGEACPIQPLCYC